LDLAVFAFGYVHLMTETSNVTFTDAHDDDILLINRTEDGRLLPICADPGQTSNATREVFQINRVVERYHNTQLQGWERVPKHDATYRALSSLMSLRASVRTIRQGQDIIALQSENKMTNSKLKATQVELDMTKVELREMQAELNQTKVELNKMQAELNQTKVELREMQAELNQTKVELREMQAKLNQKKVELNKMHEKLNQTKVELHEMKTDFNAKFDRRSRTVDYLSQIPRIIRGQSLPRVCTMNYETPKFVVLPWFLVP
jgi:chromosome segregation ATPase